MTRLSWNNVGERYYETGIDRGVLYVGSNAGVPWPGLISVSENPSGGDSKSYYLDGTKYLNVASPEDFEATIEAFASPPEFAPCDGSLLATNGLVVTKQRRQPFSMSYRTQVGNDLDGPYHAYKIHIIYDAVAAPTDYKYQTLGDATEPETLSWDISTTPSYVVGSRPTAHFVIDSRNTPSELLTKIEDILYGSDLSAARIPSAQELYNLFDTFFGVNAGTPGETASYIDGGTPTAIFTDIMDGGVLFSDVETSSADAGGTDAYATVIYDGGDPSSTYLEGLDGGAMYSPNPSIVADAGSTTEPTDFVFDGGSPSSPSTTSLYGGVP